MEPAAPSDRGGGTQGGESCSQLDIIWSGRGVGMGGISNLKVRFIYLLCTIWNNIFPSHTSNHLYLTREGLIETSISEEFSLNPGPKIMRAGRDDGGWREGRGDMGQSEASVVSRDHSQPVRRQQYGGWGDIS